MNEERKKINKEFDSIGEAMAFVSGFQNDESVKVINHGINQNENGKWEAFVIIEEVKIRTVR